MKQYFLLGILVIMTAFAAIPDVEASKAVYIHWFPLNKEMVLTAQTWVYFIFNHVVLILLSYMLWKEIPEHRRAFRAFFCIQIFYLLQYLLRYNAVWFHIGEIGVSSHIITVLFLAYVIYEE